MQKTPLTWKLVDAEAAALGVSVDTRRKWRQPGRCVPHAIRAQIIDVLAKRKIKVAFADFDALPRNPGRIAA